MKPFSLETPLELFDNSPPQLSSFDHRAAAATCARQRGLRDPPRLEILSTALFASSPCFGGPVGAVGARLRVFVGTTEIDEDHKTSSTNSSTTNGCANVGRGRSLGGVPGLSLPTLARRDPGRSAVLHRRFRAGEPHSMGRGREERGEQASNSSSFQHRGNDHRPRYKRRCVSCHQ